MIVGKNFGKNDESYITRWFMDILEIGYKGFLLIVDIFIGIIIGEFLFVYFYFLLFYFLFDIFIEC